MRSLSIANQPTTVVIDQTFDKNTNVITDKEPMANTSTSNDRVRTLKFHLSNLKLNASTQPHLEPINIFVQINQHRPTLCKSIKPLCVRQSAFQLNVICTIFLPPSKHNSLSKQCDHHIVVMIVRKKQVIGQSIIPHPDPLNLKSTASNRFRSISPYTVNLLNEQLDPFRHNHHSHDENHKNKIIGRLKIKAWESFDVSAYLEPCYVIKDHCQITSTEKHIGYPLASTEQHQNTCEKDMFLDQSCLATNAIEETQAVDGEVADRISASSSSDTEEIDSGLFTFPSPSSPMKLDFLRRIQDVLCRIQSDIRRWDLDLSRFKVAPSYVKHSISSSSVSICNYSAGINANIIRSSIEVKDPLSLVVMDSRFSQLCSTECHSIWDRFLPAKILIIDQQQCLPVEYNLPSKGTILVLGNDNLVSWCVQTSVSQLSYPPITPPDVTTNTQRPMLNLFYVPIHQAEDEVKKVDSPILRILDYAFEYFPLEPALAEQTEIIGNDVSLAPDNIDVKNKCCDRKEMAVMDMNNGSSFNRRFDHEHWLTLLKADNSCEQAVSYLVNYLCSSTVMCSVELRISQIVLNRGIDSKLVPFLVEVKISIKDDKNGQRRESNASTTGNEVKQANRLRLDVWQASRNPLTLSLIEKRHRRIRIPSLICRLYADPSKCSSSSDLLLTTGDLLQVSFEYRGKASSMKRVQKLVCSGIKGVKLHVDVDSVPYADVNFVQISPSWYTNNDRFRFYG